jgi:hypothetical protein
MVCLLQNRRGQKKLLSFAELSDLPPHPRPLSRKGRGEGRLSFCPRALGGEGGAQRRVRGSICVTPIMRSSVSLESYHG